MLKCALIGPGRMGMNYAKVVQQSVLAEIVAVCGNSRKTTEENASFLNVPLYFDNKWDEMFANHPEIDTVFITTPEWAHLAPFEAAVEHGKNVIIEKPVGISMDELQKMEQLAKANSHLKFLVCHTCRFDQRYVQAKALLDSGEIGEVGYLYTRRNPDIETAKRVKGKMPMSYWITGHDIDILRWFLHSEVKEVFASSGKDDNFISANLLFENGARAVIEVIWLGTPVLGQQHSRMDIEGKKGKIELNISAASVVQFTSEKNTLLDEHDFVELHGKYVGSTPNMIHHFIDVLVNKSKEVINFNDGIVAVKVCEAIHQSIQKNNVITL